MKSSVANREIFDDDDGASPSEVLAQPREPVRAIVLAGGGTAGHVNPLLAVADEIRRRNPDAKILVLGTVSGLEAELVPARGYELWPIPKVPLPRRASLDLFRLPGRLRRAVSSARAAIESVDAQVVIGFGGYVSTPLYLAARRTKVPLVVQEQNARPGLANRLGMRWARAVAFTFPVAGMRRSSAAHAAAHLVIEGSKAEVVGLPLRREIVDLARERAVDSRAARERAAARLGLDPVLPTLLVSGGSSGAASLNAATVAAAPGLVGAGVQVLHLTGKGKAADAEQAAASLPNYHVREYLAAMELALASADLVLTRAGAGMVCELAALGLPAIYVPLPIGNGEQARNVAQLIQAGGGIEVRDQALSAELLLDIVPPLLTDPERLKAMAKAAESVGILDAASRIVDLLEEAAEPVAP